MEWYYAANNQQSGPVSQEQLDALLTNGTINGSTLVWRTGFADWVSYASVNNSATPALPTHFAVAAPMPKNTIWRSGKNLVAPLDCTLPARCIKCNEPTSEEPIKRKLYWHSPAYYLALLLNVIVYVIIAMCVRKKATVQFYVCKKHRVARRNAILTSWGLVIVGFFITGVGISQNLGLAVLGGILFSLSGLIYGVIRSRYLFATKINLEHSWIGGCHADFVATFPEWTGSK